MLFMPPQLPIKLLGWELSGFGVRHECKRTARVSPNDCHIAQLRHPLRQHLLLIRVGCMNAACELPV